jgi:hypothetical protein
MMAFAGMLVEAAEQAGMKVPPDPDEFVPTEFPHFHVFCNVQLARPLVMWGEHWENAKIVAAIPEADLQTITLQQLMAKGLSYAQ